MSTDAIFKGNSKNYYKKSRATTYNRSNSFNGAAFQSVDFIPLLIFGIPEPRQPSASPDYPQTRRGVGSAADGARTAAASSRRRRSVGSQPSKFGPDA